MSSENQDLRSLLSNVEKFLHQQQELYGDLILPSGHRSETMSSRKHPQPAPEQDLFGTPAPSQAQGLSAAPYPNEPWAGAETLDHLNTQICTCLKCPLGHTRTKFVFGVGNPHASLVLVGEAPGADEDRQGEPFVGRAGQLLNKILEAIHFQRNEVYICNILKCRPPNNREPQPEEVAECEPYLWKQLELIRPKLILCLGRVAAQVLLKTNESLTSLRGRTHDYRGIPLMVTYHPAALLRNPNWKRPTWEDVQKVKRMVDELTHKER